MSDFEIKLASSKADVESVQRLRFEVFNLEMRKGLQSSFIKGLDCDEFDDICDHMLILHKPSKRVIGTYRLLLGRKLGAKGRFYAENEFDLSNLRELRKDMLEMGRSCVHKDFRRNSIVMLLWSGIIDYVRSNRAVYITGCPSIYSVDPAEISDIFGLLKKDHYSPACWRVKPLQGRAFEPLNRNAAVEGREKKIMLSLPSLVRSYLKFGAFVCGEPVLDSSFGSVDFFMMLEMSKISSSYIERIPLPAKGHQK